MGHGGLSHHIPVNYPRTRSSTSVITYYLNIVRRNYDAMSNLLIVIGSRYVVFVDAKEKNLIQMMCEYCYFVLHIGFVGPSIGVGWLLSVLVRRFVH